jgi:hypothetical protein
MVPGGGNQGFAVVGGVTIVRDLVVIGGLTVAVLLASAGVVAVLHRPLPENRPVDTTVRLVTAEPPFYHGRLVRLSSEGFQPGDGDDGRTIVFRKVAGQPPVLTCTFTKPPSPSFLTSGRKFVGKVVVAGDAVTVVDCVPD